MEEKGNRGSSGISLLNIITAVFVGLKLGGVIDWSWWLVFMPTLVELGIGILFILIALIIVVIIEKM